MGLEVSESEGLEVSESVGFEVSESGGQQVSESEGLEVSESVGFEVSESGGQEVSESEGQGVSESVGFEVSESEGLEVSESDAKVSESGGREFPNPRAWEFPNPTLKFPNPTLASVYAMDPTIIFTSTSSIGPGCCWPSTIFSWDSARSRRGCPGASVISCLTHNWLGYLW